MKTKEELIYKTDNCKLVFDKSDRIVLSNRFDQFGNLAFVGSLDEALELFQSHSQV